jgi:hypothetical protein
VVVALLNFQVKKLPEVAMLALELKIIFIMMNYSVTLCSQGRAKGNRLR